MIYDAHVVHAGRFRKYVLLVLFFLVPFLSHGDAISRAPD